MSVKVEVKKEILFWSLSRAGYYKEEDFSRVFPHIKSWLSGQKNLQLNNLQIFPEKSICLSGISFR